MGNVQFVSKLTVSPPTPTAAPSKPSYPGDTGKGTRLSTPDAFLSSHPPLAHQTFAPGGVRRTARYCYRHFHGSGPLGTPRYVPFGTAFSNLSIPYIHIPIWRLALSAPQRPPGSPETPVTLTHHVQTNYTYKAIEF